MLFRSSNWKSMAAFSCFLVVFIFLIYFTFDWTKTKIVTRSSGGENADIAFRACPYTKICSTPQYYDGVGKLASFKEVTLDRGTIYFRLRGEVDLVVELYRNDKLCGKYNFQTKTGEEKNFLAVCSPLSGWIYKIFPPDEL